MCSFFLFCHFIKANSDTCHIQVTFYKIITEHCTNNPSYYSKVVKYYNMSSVSIKAKNQDEATGKVQEDDGNKNSDSMVGHVIVNDDDNIIDNNNNNNKSVNDNDTSHQVTPTKRKHDKTIENDYEHDEDSNKHDKDNDNNKEDSNEHDEDSDEDWSDDSDEDSSNNNLATTYKGTLSFFTNVYV